MIVMNRFDNCWHFSIFPIFLFEIRFKLFEFEYSFILLDKIFLLITISGIFLFYYTMWRWIPQMRDH